MHSKARHKHVSALPLPSTAAQRSPPFPLFSLSQLRGAHPPPLTDPPAEVYHENAREERKLEDKVTVAHSIHGVGANATNHAKLLGKELAVNKEGVSSNGSCVLFKWVRIMLEFMSSELSRPNS